MMRSQAAANIARDGNNNSAEQISAVSSSDNNNSITEQSPDAMQLHNQRLLTLLQNLGAQVDEIGITVVKLNETLSTFPSTTHPLLTLRDLLAKLIPAAQLSPLQRLELLQTIQDEVSKLDRVEYATLKNALLQVQQAYQQFIQTFNTVSVEERAKMLEKSVQFYCDSLPEPYLISVADAQTLTSSDLYGYTVKSNTAGNRPVASLGGLFFKVNPSRDHIAPATEQALVNFYQLIAKDKADLIAAPTALVKINYLPVQTLLPKDQQADRAAYEKYNDELLSGKSATAILAHNNLASKLQFTQGHTGKVLQVGYGLGDICLRDMLALVAMFAELNHKMPKSQLALLYQAVVTTENFLKLMQGEEAIELEEAATHPSTLMTYWFDFLAHIPPNERPKDFSRFDRVDATKLALNWRKLVDQYGMDALTQTIALLKFCPNLMAGHDFHDLIDNSRLLNLAPSIWPAMEIDELMKTTQTWLAQGDKKHFSQLIVGSMLSNPSDGKGDNYRVKLLRNEQGQAVKWQIQAIDNDNALVEAVTYDADPNKVKAGFKVNVLCILYFLPQMAEKIDPEVRDYLLSKTAAHWVLDWLYQLYCHDQRYQQFIQRGILTKDDLMDANNEPILDIPFSPRVDLIREIYVKWFSLQKALKKNPAMTHQELLNFVEPLIAHYYSAQHYAHPNPIDAFHLIHQDRAPIEEILKLNANINAPLIPGKDQTIAEALQSIQEAAKQKYQDSASPEDYATVARPTIQEALAEMLSYINLATHEEKDAYELLAAISRFPDVKFNLKVTENVQEAWLRSAVAKGNIQVVSLLLRSGVNVNSADERGFTALHEFAEHFDQSQYTDESAEQMAELLLSAANIAPHVEDEKGLPPLFYAMKAAKRAPARTERFLQQWTAHKLSLDHNAMEKEYAETNNSNNNNNNNNNNHAVQLKINSKTALDKCIERNHPQAFALLVKYGASHSKDVRTTMQFIERHLAEPYMPTAQKKLQQQNPKFNYESALATLTLDTPPTNNQSAIVLQGALSGTRYLPANLAALLFDETGHLRKVAPEQNKQQNPDGPQIHIYTNGRHPVTRVTYHGKSLVFKEQPDLPGIDYAVGAFAQALIGHGTAYNELFAVKDKDGKTYPLLIAEFIDGENFDHVIEPKKSGANLTAAEAMAFLSQLDKKKLSELIILCSLINPEDWKPDAFVLAPFKNAQGQTSYRLVGVDNDHSFIPPVVSEGETRKLQLKTIIFCLDAMQESLHPEAVQEFLSKDPEAFLRSWLIDIERQQNEYANLIFSSSKKLSLFRSNKLKLEDSIIGMPFKPKTMSDLYFKFVKIQKELRKDPNIPALSLFRKVMPAAGVYYQEAFKSGIVQTQTPAARFFYLVKDLYDMKNNRYQTMTTNLQVMQSLTVTAKEDLAKQQVYGPKEARAILELLVTEHQRIEQVIKACEAGKFSTTYTPIHSLLQDSSKEEVMAQIDWSKLNLKQQEILLKSFIGIPFVNLRIKNCEALTDEILIEIINQSPELKLLALDNCPQITSEALTYVSINAKNLEKLHLTKYNGKFLTIFNDLNYKLKRYQKLRRLILRDCPDFEFVDKSKLTKTDYDKSELDILRHAGLLQLKDLRINDCTNLNLETLTNLLEVSQAYSYLELDQKLNLDRKLLKEAILRNNLWTIQNLSYFIEPSFQGAQNVLNLSGQPAVTNEDIIKIGQCISVTSVYEDNNTINQTGRLITLLRSFPALINFLNFSYTSHKAWNTPLIAVLPNSNIAIGVNNNRMSSQIKVWDLQIQTCILTLKDDNEGIIALRALPNGNIVIGYDYYFEVCDLQKQKIILTLKTNYYINTLSALPNGDIVTGDQNCRIKVWDLQNQTCVLTLENDASIIELAALPNGNIVSGDNKCQIKVWDLQNQTCLLTLKNDYSITNLAVLPNGNIVSGDKNGEIKVWDLQKQNCKLTLGNRFAIYTLAILPNGNLVCSDKKGEIYIWRFWQNSALNYRHKLSSQTMIKKISSSGLVVKLPQTLNLNDIEPALRELQLLIDLELPTGVKVHTNKKARQLYLYIRNQDKIEKIFELLEAYVVKNIELPLTPLNLDDTDLTDEERQFWQAQLGSNSSQTLASTKSPQLSQTISLPALPHPAPTQRLFANDDEIDDATLGSEDNAALRLIELKLAEGFSLEAQLFAACEKGELENVRWLLQQGANARAKTKDKQTAVSIAQAKGHQHVVNYLQNFKQPLAKDKTIKPQSCVVIRMWPATFKQSAVSLPVAVMTTNFVDDVNVGHISIAIRDENGRETYVSHWPSDERVGVFSSKGTNNTLFEDLSDENNLPTSVIVLYSLDCAKMLAYYASIKDKLIWSLSGSKNANNSDYNCSGCVYKLLEAGGLFQHLLSEADKIKFGVLTPRAVVELAKKAQSLENMLYPETIAFKAYARERFKLELMEKSKQNFEIFQPFLMLNLDLLFLLYTYEKVTIQELSALKALDLNLILLFAQRYTQELQALLQEMCANAQDNLNQNLIAIVKSQNNNDEFLLSSIKLMIASGANPTTRDKEGYSALHWAIVKCRIPVVKMILDKFPQAVLSETNSPSDNLFAQIRKTPLDLAMETGNQEMINLIQDLGGNSNLKSTGQQNINNNNNNNNVINF